MRILRVLIVAGLVLLAARWTATWLAVRADRSLNRVVAGAGAPPGAAALELHRRLLLADLHADSLMWPRDLARRYPHGHLDVPRMAAGNVGLQVFSVFTQTPRNLNFIHNTADTDDLTLLAIASGWPVRTWTSLSRRALYQAERLDRLVEASAGMLVPIRERTDLRRLLDARLRGEARMGALLALEGAHALEGDPGNLERLFAAGYRMLGLAHFFDNAVAGSAHGAARHGLTAMGREVVLRAQALGMVVDASHASKAVITDLLAISRAPIVFSHSGVTATCEQHGRNLTDSELRQLARNGGVVGIALFPGATCGDDLEAFFRSLDHAVKIAGIEHVGFGSDFDGAVTAPIDAAQWVRVTDGLLRRGYDADAIRRLAGGNVVRVLLSTLPE